MASLYDVVPDALPFPIRSGLVRAVRTAIAIVISGVAASIADGSLLGAIQVIPAGYAPAVTMALTTAIMGVDKWLRERNLVEESEDTVDQGGGVLPPPPPADTV